LNVSSSHKLVIAASWSKCQKPKQFVFSINFA
jgi:hypothetical protein